MKSGDKDDAFYCESNEIDECGICDGLNSVSLEGPCSIPIDQDEVNQLDCESAGGIWPKVYEGPDIDCGGFCGLPDTLKAVEDECTGECCGGYTGIPCSKYINSANFRGDYDCLGVCGGAAKLDDCGICDGKNKKDSNGSCVFIIYPGDTDMSRSVDLSDITPIINNWGKRVNIRPNIDQNGSSLKSKDVWEPQTQPLSKIALEDTETQCLYYADANGDGIINIYDVTTVFKNIGESHSEIVNINCSNPARESDYDIYYSIFQSISDGELKKKMADIYGFELPPKEFEVYQNYPNPFNPITSIDYVVPEKGSVVIEIYNVNGQKIDKFNFINIASGYHSFVWDASYNAAGIYYYRFYFNNKLVHSRKMLFLK